MTFFITWCPKVSGRLRNSIKYESDFGKFETVVKGVCETPEYKIPNPIIDFGCCCVGLEYVKNLVVYNKSHVPIQYKVYYSNYYCLVNFSPSWLLYQRYRRRNTKLCKTNQYIYILLIYKNSIN